MVTLCHLSQLPKTQAAKFGSKTAIVYRDAESGKWTPLSWCKFSDIVDNVARALISIGTVEQENVAVFSQNKAECFFTNFGCYSVRATVIPFYATCSVEQAGYMISDAEVKTLFVGEQRQYDTAFPLLSITPTLKRIIIFDRKVKRNPSDHTSVYFDEFLALGKDTSLNAEMQRRRSSGQMDDICDILYTSGTTGHSKGVVLTYGMYNNAFEQNSKVLPITERDIFLNFLPLSHILERACSYLGLSIGAVQVVNTNPHDVVKAMQEIKPTCMCAVPRFWEKLYEGVLEKVNSGNPIKRRIFAKAMEVGRHIVEDYKSKGLTPPAKLKWQYKIYDKLAFSIIRKTCGLERPNIFPTAGATISRDIEVFVHACGIDFIAGYGLTETTATVACDHKGKPFSIGSVGRVLPGVEVKISEDGEILVKGKSVLPRYYRRPKITAETIDKDGWFHTGDAGYLKGDELFLTDRIKDLYKTSNRKYIAPQQIEAKLVVDKYIDQIVIIADRYKYVSALIVPAYDRLEQYAQKHGISYANREELCHNDSVKEMIMERIETLQQGLASFEQVKRITLLPHPFSMENNELTNTLKVKRRLVFERYAKEIEQMYK